MEKKKWDSLIIMSNINPFAYILPLVMINKHIHWVHCPASFYKTRYTFAKHDEDNDLLARKQILCCLQCVVATANLNYIQL